MNLSINTGIQANGGRMRILVADDSNIERMILKELFESEGHAVEAAENGETALRLAVVSLPELIVSDILMPVMDGFSFCKSIRSDSRTAHIPFLFYTATYTKPEDEALGIKIGADGFFRKPMEWDDFYAAVVSLVRKIEKSGRVPKIIPDEEEGDLYKLYNERLIKKLEDKAFELEKEVRWRKKIEAQLRDSSQRLELAIEGANISIWDWEIASRAGHFTGKWVENLGYQIDEIAPHFDSWEKLLHPDDRVKTLNSVKANLAGQTKFYENEHRILDASGKWRWVLARGKVVERDEKGNPLRQAGTFMEITDRKTAEEELKKSRGELRELSKYLQTTIEKEKIRIAQEIHDDLGQILTAIKLEASWLIDKIPKGNTSIFKKANAVVGLVDQTILSVKKIITDLRPGILDDLGLAAAVEWQAKDYQQRTGAEHTVFIEPEDIRVNAELSTAIFRICQEALTNAARHSGASQVLVKIVQQNGMFNVSIMDNGIGIDESKISDSGSFGLIGMRERAASFGGFFEISKGNAGGTKVIVKIPNHNQPSN
jgi:two-component system, NarL family, sensor histidine kinase UhpB